MSIYFKYIYHIIINIINKLLKIESSTINNDYIVNILFNKNFTFSIPTNNNNNNNKSLFSYIFNTIHLSIEKLPSEQRNTLLYTLIQIISFTPAELLNRNEEISLISPYIIQAMKSGINELILISLKTLYVYIFYFFIFLSFYLFLFI